MRDEADRLLWNLIRGTAAWTGALTVTALAGAVAETLLPAMLGRAVDTVLTDGDTAGPVMFCAGLIAVVVVCDAFGEWGTGSSTARATARLRHLLIGHLLSVGPRATRRFSSGDLVSRVVGGAADAGNGPAAAATIVAAVIPVVGGLIALTLIDPWLTVAFAAGIPAIVMLLRAFTRQTSDVTTRYLEVQGKIAGRLVDALGGIRTIAVAGTQDRETDRVLGPLPELREHGLQMWRIQARAQSRAVLLVPMLQIVVLTVAGFGLAAGRITPGEMLAASQYVLLAAGVGPVTSGLGRLARARAGARRGSAVLAAPSVPYGTGQLAVGQGTLEFRDIRVERDGERILDRLDLVVPGGMATALVGRSGAGKSVLAALCGRMIEPDAGEVLLDGVPVSSIGRAVLRREVGYAFERPVLWGDSIGDAIGLGQENPPLDIVHGAARAACADDFIQRLPDGYRTALAEAPMSGGEAQRIGLARAFAHAGRVLVLDDATSSLDTVTESRVTTALTSEFADRTRLIVAHRAATAGRADLVVWLDAGRVRAWGPHHVLWQDPDYRAVFEPAVVEPSPSGRAP